MILECSRSFYNRAIIGCKCNLTTSKKSVITPEFTKGKLILEISKIIGRYHQSQKMFAVASTKVHERGDKSH